jgi:Trk K+ transport system NAD-binding subunit
LARRISDSFVVRRNRNEIKLYKSMDPDFNDLPEIVKKICTSDYHNISAQDLKELLNTDDLDFEKFSKEEDEVLEEVIATKEEMSETPVAEVTSREEIEEKILEEDNPEIKEDGPQTRSKTAQQLEKAATEDNIEKEVHFDATAEKPQVKFF